jgi:hypothetical protein
MIEERDANPTADTPGCFRGRRAPTALTAGGTESSEVVARLSGTESSNPPQRRVCELSDFRVTRGRGPTRPSASARMRVQACASAGDGVDAREREFSR